MVFVSDADGLSTLDVDTSTNVYVRDTVTNETELVSRASGASGAGGERPSPTTRRSPTTGRASCSTRPPARPGGHRTRTRLDIYVRDLCTDTTYLGSRRRRPAGPVDRRGRLARRVRHVRRPRRRQRHQRRRSTSTSGRSERRTSSSPRGCPERTPRRSTPLSTRTSLSDSGTIVAFETDSAQLDAAGDTNGASDIAVRRLSTEPHGPERHDDREPRRHRSAASSGTGSPPIPPSPGTARASRSSARRRTSSAPARTPTACATCSASRSAPASRRCA